MKITLKFLEIHDACEEGIECFKEHYTEIEHEELIADLIKIKKYNWIVWLISRLLTKIDDIKLRIFAAESCQYVFNEDEKDEVIKRCAETSKKAINAVKKYINEQTEENKILCSAASDAATAESDAAEEASYAASYAAAAASYAVWTESDAAVAARYAVMAASNAARAASNAARAASEAAVAARYAVWAASDAARAASFATSNAAGAASDAAWAVVAASDAAVAAIYEKIIRYGIELIKKSDVSNEDNA
jgi:hypothetical protein